MTLNRPQTRLPRRIAGGSAVEFILVFPILFGIIYGTIAYGYVYFLQQRINFVAQEAVRAAISVAPQSDNAAYVASAQAAANQSIIDNFTTGGGTLPTALSQSFLPVTNNTLTLTLTYSLTTPVLFPTLTLPLGVGTIPPLPAALTAVAAGRLS